MKEQTYLNRSPLGRKLGLLALLLTPSLAMASVIQDVAIPIGICNAALSTLCATNGTPATVTAHQTDPDNITLFVAAVGSWEMWEKNVFAFNWSGPAITTVLSATTVGGQAASFSANAANKNVSEFGKFSNSWDMTSASGGLPNGGIRNLVVNISTTVPASFNIALSDFVVNDTGYIFASHVAYIPGGTAANTTGFAGNGGPGGQNPTNTPEPASFLLAFSGAVAVWGFRRKSTLGRKQSW